MEVTQTNFKEVLNEVEKSVKNCTFLSIDCELTGLKTTQNRINTYDTTKQYYEKARTDCKNFLVIQYGISLFRYDKQDDVFKQQTYNFYIFRRPFYKYIPDQTFLCQTSSIDFLISEGFNFNKLFKDGIPYLNNSEERKCQELFQEEEKRRAEIKSSKQNENYDKIPIPDDAQEFIEDIVKQLKDFLESGDNELQLPRCNAFLRRLIYQTHSEMFADQISLETRQINKDRLLFATRLKSIEEIQEIEKKKRDELLSQLEDFVGFTKVLRVIVDSGKLIIGHNLLLDFLHTIDKFLMPLPDDYIEFKECARFLFSKVLDTKFMSSLEPFKELITSNVLNHLLNSVSNKPFEIPKVEIEQGGQGYTLKDQKEHEAGYDAYITGLSFLAMWKYLGTLQNLSNAEAFDNFKLLEPFINKIFLMTLADNQYINLDGDDSNPSREHVFYITFPKEWKTSNIVQLFSPFGNVNVSWLDDTSAYVGLYKRDQAAVALSTLSQSETYSIMTYNRRQAQLTGIRTPLPSPLVKKRKSSEGHPPTSKKRRTGSFDGSSFSGAKRSIDPIEEEDHTETESDAGLNSKTPKKTFAEDESWD